MAESPTLGQLDVLENSFNALPLASISVTDSGHILQINLKCKTLLGLPSHNCKNSNLWELLSPPDMPYSPTFPPLFMVFQWCLKRGSWSGHVQVVQRSETHSGEVNLSLIIVYLRLQKTFFRDANHSIQPFFTCVMEEPTSHVNTDFQFILDTMPIGFCMWRCADKETLRFVLLAINQKAEDILGIRIAIDSTLDEAVDVKSNPLVREFFKDILHHQRTIYRPYFALGNNEFSLTAFPMLENCLGMILEKCKPQDGSLVSMDQSTTPFAILRVCNDPLIDYGNFGFVALTGYESHELQEKPLREILVLHPENPEDKAAYRLLIDDIKSNRRGSVEIRIHSKSGNQYISTIQYIPLKDSTGRTYRYLLFFHVY